MYQRKFRSLFVEKYISEELSFEAPMMKICFFFAVCISVAVAWQPPYMRDYAARLDAKDKGESEPLEKPESPEEIQSEGCFESDMKLTPEQQGVIDAGINDEKLWAFKRKAITSVVHRWDDNTVYYEISQSSSGDADVITEAIQYWEQQTCLRFVLRENTTPRAPNYISFIKGGGCYSYAGQIGGKQDLSIGQGCASFGVVTHEIGHAIGFVHEQSRPDRDDYVTIHLENVVSGLENQFSKYSASMVLQDVAYDVSSVMHYGTHYFSTNGSPTIITKNPNHQLLIGNREGPTFADIKMANFIYNCNASCNAVENTCENGGYVDVSCGSCVCPPRFSGDRCQIEEADTGCLLDLTDPTGVLESPNFPSDYDIDTTCGWYIKGEEGTTVGLTFEAFDLEDDVSCRWDYVRIRAEGNVHEGGTSYCGTSVPDYIESTTNEMYVIFRSDVSITKSGFKATYEIINPEGPGESSSSSLSSSSSSDSSSSVGCEDMTGICGGYMNAECGIISTPNYPDKYGGSAECVWEIEVDPGKRVELLFETFALQPHAGKCNKDYVAIYPDSEDIEIPLRLCGKEIPSGSFISTQNSMRVKFKSNKSKNYDGFLAYYQAVVV